MKVNSKMIWPFLLLALFLPGVDGVAQEADELQRLSEQQKQLAHRIGELKQEQEFYLFKREFYTSDSKYLLFDFSKGMCRLKYRNRILKDISFSVSPKGVGRVNAPGIVILTKKRGLSGKKQALVFGAAFIVQSTRKEKPLPDERQVPRIILSRRDMRSLFYALEEGAKAYIVR